MPDLQNVRDDAQGPEVDCLVVGLPVQYLGRNKQRRPTGRGHQGIIGYLGETEVGDLEHGVGVIGGPEDVLRLWSG